MRNTNKFPGTLSLTSHWAPFLTRIIVLFAFHNHYNDSIALTIYIPHPTPSTRSPQQKATRLQLFTNELISTGTTTQGKP